jgi:hypothetical protein
LLAGVVLFTKALPGGGVGEADRKVTIERSKWHLVKLIWFCELLLREVNPSPEIFLGPYENCFRIFFLEFAREF